MNPRKPNKRTVTRIARETAKHLRDLVAAFCRARDGVEIKERHVTKDFGTFGASWRVPTQYGAWIVHEPSDPCTGLVSINTRFEDDAVKAPLVTTAWSHLLNPYSLKWNHNAVVDASTDPAQFAATFILDLDHRSKFLFLPRELETPRSDERSAPSATRRRERALPSAALGDKVGGKRRAAPARVVRNDEHGVLPQDVADVSGEARRLGDERRAPTPVELRTVDVDGEAGLALAKKHTRRRRNGVADEVFVGGSGNDRGGLCRVDRPTQRRAGEGLALAKADDNADRARRHRLSEPSEAGRRSTTTEAHVRSVTRERAAFKKWAAPDYVIVWFDGPSRVRLTIERFADAADALVAAGWKEMDGGRFRRTTTLKALPQVLMRVGELLAEKGSAP